MPVIESVSVGDKLPVMSFTPDNVDLFFYNAVLWNAHRIHFDLPYATEEEGYPGLVIAGPLMGDWLTQCVENWLADSGRLKSIEYSNRQAAYIGETLTAQGEVTSVNVQAGAVTLTLSVVNEKGEQLTPGEAVVHLGSTAAEI